MSEIQVKIYVRAEMNMKDYEKMVKAYKEAGGKHDIFKDSKVAHLIVHKNKILGSHLIEGLILNVEEKDCGVDIDLKVEEGFHIIHPVHLCFGVLPMEGKQKIKVNMLIEKEAEMAILAHCIFPNAVKIQHIMEAKIELEDKAVLRYDEVHYHGLTGGIEVVPQAIIKIGKGACFITNFSLTKGRVGKLDINYQAEVDANGILEMVTQVYGYGEDEIKVRENGRLFGDGSKGLIKSRIAVRDRAESEVISELEASAPNARGHVDCIEIVQGEARAKAIPMVNVQNEKAQVTHEASIGRANQKELETLMARGLDPEEAIDIIIGGLLK
jgi:Fe-S cluster assembly scaffold protein SufB